MTTSSGAPVVIRVSPDQNIEFPHTMFATLKTRLRLENISVSPSFVGFKIKTTAPKNYLVRPSTGVIPPQGSQDVEIILQPLTTEPTSGQDRFLVQATTVDDDTQQLPRDYWQNVDKRHLQEQRLSVLFRKSENGGAGGLADGEATASTYNTHTVETNYATVPNADITGNPGTSNNLENHQQRYEQLVQYCLSLEKKNIDLSRDLDILKRTLEPTRDQSNPGASAANPAAGASRLFGMEFWHWFLIGVLLLIFLKITDRI